MTDNGSAVSAGDFVSLDDILSGLLVYTPVTNAFGTTESFTFKVQDDGGTANGGVDLDPDAKTMTIEIAPPISLLSVEVNGGYGLVANSDYYEDYYGNTVDLSGQSSIVVSLLVTFNEPVTLDSGAFTVTPVPITTSGPTAGYVYVVSGSVSPNQSAVTVTTPIPVGGGTSATQWVLTFSGAGTFAVPCEC